MRTTARAKQNYENAARAPLRQKRNLPATIFTRARRYATAQQGKDAGPNALPSS
ncbi:MAG: hypothetical protein HC850_05105 [Rhodomicrobium sp.]|nr:hypothetical protein [Rhodomicrobium sp.]